MLTKDLSIAERVQPCFIEPMLADAVRELPNGGLWTYEAKLDGYRCLAANRNGHIVLWSRRGNGFTSRFPEIVRACEKLPPETLIDGEVVAIDESGRVSFNSLQHSRHSTELQFYVFDILVHRSRSVLRLPLEVRRELLAESLAKVEYPVLRSQAYIEDFSQLCEKRGVVIAEVRIATDSMKRNGTREGCPRVAFLPADLRLAQIIAKIRDADQQQHR